LSRPFFIFFENFFFTPTLSHTQVRKKPMAIMIGGAAAAAAAAEQQ
jgi:hypothetical protein